jgi:hypothetical protein
MTEIERIRALQQRLRATLASISEQAELSALERCPYRAADDGCTFDFGCRNQLPAGERARCSGVRLNIQKR